MIERMTASAGGKTMIKTVGDFKVALAAFDDDTAIFGLAFGDRQSIKSIETANDGTGHAVVVPWGMLDLLAEAQPEKTPE